MKEDHIDCDCYRCREAEFQKSLEGLGKEIKKGKKEDAFAEGFSNFYRRKAIYEAALKKAYEKQDEDEEKRKKREKRDTEKANKMKLREKIKQEKIINKDNKKKYKEDIKERDKKIKELETRIKKLENNGEKTSVNQKISLLKQKTKEIEDGIATQNSFNNIDILKRILTSGK